MAIFPGERQKWLYGYTARTMDMERGSQPLLLNDEERLLAALPEVRRLDQFQERNDWHSDDPLQQSARIYQWLKGLYDHDDANPRGDLAARPQPAGL